MKKELSFEITENPNSQDLDFLTQKINEEAGNHGSAHPFAIFIRDKIGKILAGCNGSVFFGSIYTDQLWVHPAYRKKGVGRALLEKVHEYGKKHGCTLTTVATMNFQAPQFYQKLGYQVEFTRLGLKDNISVLFMRKDL